MAGANKENGLTLTVLGCGTLGTAILSGIMDSLDDIQSSSSSQSTEDLPPRLPSCFNACVRRPESAKRIKTTLSAYKTPITTYENDNLSAVKAADVVILGCKPYMISVILQAPGIKDALKGKLLLSILAGVPEEQLEDVLYPGQTHAQILEVPTLFRAADALGDGCTSTCSSVLAWLQPLTTTRWP